MVVTRVLLVSRFQDLSVLVPVLYDIVIFPVSTDILSMATSP